MFSQSLFPWKRFLLPGFALLVLLLALVIPLTTASAQTTVRAGSPDDCSSLEQDLSVLQEELQALSEAMDYATTQQKYGIGYDIYQVSKKISQKQAELKACLDSQSPTPTPQVPPPCVSILDDIHVQNEQLVALTKEMNQAGPEEKRGIAQEISSVSEQISQLESQFLACERDAGIPQPLLTTFTGMAIVTTTFEKPPMPHMLSLSMGIFFTPDRKEVSLVFPMLPLPGLPVTVSLMNQDSGSFNKATGEMSIGVTFNFSIPGPDSQATFAFTTGTSVSPSQTFKVTGSPLDSNTLGITLVGTSQFQNGGLGGYECSVVMSGTLDILP